MDENKNHIKNKMGEQLPSHSPDPGTWQRLSAKLDALDAEAAYQEKLQGLPVHSPDEGTWSIIAYRLNRIAYYKTGIRIAISAAAGLLLFFTVSRISDQYQTTTFHIPQVASQDLLTDPPAEINQANPLTTENTETSKKNTKSVNANSDNKIVTFSSGIRGTTTAERKSENTAPGNSIVADAKEMQEVIKVEAGSETMLSENVIALTDEIQVPSVSSPEPVNQNASIHDGTLPVKEILKTDNETRSILFQKEQYAVSPPPSLKYYAPTEPKPAGNKNNFALAMGYFPENMDNGTNTSLFHNVDLTASYNKEKVRYNTSLGMAYNEEQLQFEVSYDINMPVTAMGPGGKLDTLSYESANMDSEYLGTEKHKYVTYNLGFGRKLFSSGKFSTWINAGAGFGIKLNEPDLISTTASSIKGQYNARNVSVNSTKPVYNDVNVNFITAIDFNYKVISKLSISFAPVSRWYFKPVLSKNNQATDELTLGFRTGLKFDF